MSWNILPIYAKWRSIKCSKMFNEYGSLVAATSHAWQLKVGFGMAMQDSIGMGHLATNPEINRSNTVVQVEHG